MRTTSDEARRFNAEQSIGFPSLHDPGGTIAASYGIAGVPTYIFLDRQGRVAFRSAEDHGMAPIKQNLRRLEAEP